MSLRDLGVFLPLEAKHPIVSQGAIPCWKCGIVLCAGVRPALMPIETSEESGSLTVRAMPVCATCYLKGQEIGTPAGRRIVERVKDGDGSPYPVVTTDGKQWRDEEVTL